MCSRYVLECGRACSWVCILRGGLGYIHRHTASIFCVSQCCVREYLFEGVEGCVR